jgi:hypothetical protein
MTSNTLQNYYQTTYTMVQHHKWNFSDWENLILWERDIYLDMLMKELKSSTTANLSKDELALIKSTGKKNQAILDVVSTTRVPAL